MAAKFIANVASEGTIYGFTVSDKIGFFGVTPVVRPAVSAAASSSAVNAANFAVLVSALGSLGLITAGG